MRDDERWRETTDSAGDVTVCIRTGSGRPPRVCLLFFWLPFSFCVVPFSRFSFRPLTFAISPSASKRDDSSSHRAVFPSIYSPSSVCVSRLRVLLETLFASLFFLVGASRRAPGQTKQVIRWRTNPRAPRNPKEVGGCWVSRYGVRNRGEEEDF